MWVEPEEDAAAERRPQMLQVTENAASAFRGILENEGMSGNAIRIVPTMEGNGQVGITLQAVQQPAPDDAETSAEGVQVVVAPELAPSLEESILDAKDSGEGPEFFLRSQEGPPA
jgi:Fe-S cluster assembly iron-binding protein IscA